MSSVDPRRLIPALEEYERELRAWMNVTSGVADDVHFAHRHGAEAHQQGQHRLAVAASRADEDELVLQQTADEHRRETGGAEQALASATAAYHTIHLHAEVARSAVRHSYNFV